MTYYVGDELRFTATFTDNLTGLLADPSTVTIAAHAPDGTLTTGSTQDGTGVYHLDVLFDGAGEWKITASGSGALNAVADPAIIAVEVP